MLSERHGWPASLSSPGSEDAADEEEVREALEDEALKAPDFVEPTGISLDELVPESLAVCSECGLVVYWPALEARVRRMPGKGFRSGLNVEGFFCPGCDHRILDAETAHALADKVEKRVGGEAA